MFTDKKLTDNSYNLGIRTLSKYKFDTLLSTHNEESIRLGCINNIFKPGYSTKDRGWGLGLNLSKRIINTIHKGKIVLLKSTINQRTFRIKLRSSIS